jgi:hypothetical protein
VAGGQDPDVLRRGRQAAQAGRGRGRDARIVPAVDQQERALQMREVRGRLERAQAERGEPCDRAEPGTLAGVVGAQDRREMVPP